MNIAFDATAIEMVKGGGMGNYTENQFKSLIKLYPEHNFFYFNVINEFSYLDSFNTANFTKHYFYMGKGHLLSRYNGEHQELYGELVSRFVKENNIDIFYVTAPFLPGHVVYKKEWFGETYVVATLYDIIPFIFSKHYMYNEDGCDFPWYMNCIDFLRTADKLLAISDCTKNDIVTHLGFDKEKIDVIYSGVSEKYKVLAISDEVKIPLLKKWRINRKFVLCAVSKDWRKNTGRMIKAWVLLPTNLRNQYQLVIAGRLDDKEKHQNELAELGLTDSVVLTDYIEDDNELIMLYNLSELIVVPSIYEGFGLPVIEGWACGKAVLASNCSSLAEIIEEPAFSFDPNDVKDIARALKDALENKPLHDYAEKGAEKLSRFTWDNVAGLTMDSLKKFKPRQSDKLNLAFVFVNEVFFTQSWQNLIKNIEKHHTATIYRSVTFFDNEKFDKIICIAPINRVNEFDSIETNTECINVLLDSDFRKLIESVNGAEDNDLLGALVKEQIRPQPERAGKFNQDKIVVANRKIKTTVQTIENLGKVYAIDLDGSNPRDGSLILRNFMLAIADKPTKIKADSLLDELLHRFIIPECYSAEEVRMLTETLGYVYATDNILNIPHHSYDRKNAKKIAMVSTWNESCGIAEYTKYFVQELTDYMRVEVWPNIIEEDVADGYLAMPRVWYRKGSADQLIAELEKSEPDIIHIQQHPSFFGIGELEKIISNADAFEAHVVVTCHNIEDFVPQNGKQQETLNKAHFVVHQEDEVSKLVDLGYSRKQVRHIPHGRVEIPESEKLKIREVLALQTHNPIIGSFGFLLDHKGIYETIEAVSLLKKHHPNIVFIACNAMHSCGASIEPLKVCNDLISKFDLQDNVIMVNDFLLPEDSVYLLQACDMFVLPYGYTKESSSAAVRFCIAAKRPFVITDQPIFGDVRDAAVVIDDNSPKAIADGILKLLEPERYESCLEAVKRMAQMYNWSETANQYAELYESLPRKIHTDIIIQRAL